MLFFNCSCFCKLTPGEFRSPDSYDLFSSASRNMELEPVTLGAWGFTGGSVIFVQTNLILEKIQISFAALFPIKGQKD